MKQGWKNGLAKAKPWLLAAGAGMLCLACFFVVWFYYLRGCGAKAQSVYLNDAYDSQTQPLEQGQTVTQEFTTESPLYAVGVVFVRLDPAVDGLLEVTLTNADTGETVLQATGNIGQVIYDSYTGFALDTPQTQSGQRHWLLCITARYTQAEGQLAMAKSSQTPEGFGALTENGQPAQGALALLATTDQLGSLPTLAFWVLGGVCALLVAGLALLCRFKRPGKAALTFAVVLAMGLCYQFVLPAYAAPDEEIHYHTAYALANQWLGIAPTVEGNNFVQRSCDVQPTFSDYRTTPYTYRYLLTHLGDPASAPGELVESQEELLGGYMVPYWLSATGIALARLLRLGGVATALFARLFNLAFFAAMAALAVRLAPRAKGMFALFALLPGVLHLGGSYSYDSMLLALSMVLVALCLRCALQQQPVSWAQGAALAAVCALLAPLKSIYLPLCLLVFLIPGRQFAQKRQRAVIQLGSIGLAGAHYAVYNLPVALNVLQRFWQTAGQGTAVAATAAGAAAPAAESATYSLFYLLAHPGVFLQLLCNTLLPNGADYAAAVLGGKLGYLNLAQIDLNGLLVVGFLLVLLLTALPQVDQRPLGAGQRALLALVALVVTGLVCVVCVYWTPASYDALWGFQGRYLFPLLLCLLPALPLHRIRVDGDVFYPALFAGAGLEILALLNVLAVVFSR